MAFRHAAGATVLRPARTCRERWQGCVMRGLQQKLWPADTFDDFDTGLHTAIRKLRPALND